MDYVIKFLSDYWLIVIIVLSVFSGGGWFVTLEGKNLRNKLNAMGDLKGKTKHEIVAVIGPPQAISASNDGKIICQWMKTGFHAVLIFNGDTCEGINSISDFTNH